MKYNVGDEVGFGKWRGSTLINSGIATVKYINGFGHITLDNGKQFDKYGYERTSSFYGYRGASYYNNISLMTADDVFNYHEEKRQCEIRNEMTERMSKLLSGTIDSNGTRRRLTNQERTEMQKMLSRL